MIVLLKSEPKREASKEKNLGDITTTATFSDWFSK